MIRTAARCAASGAHRSCAGRALVGDWRDCGVCGRRPHKRVKEASDLHKMLNRNITALTIANNVFQYDLVPKEGGEAKRRKRA